MCCLFLFLSKTLAQVLPAADNISIFDGTGPLHFYSNLYYYEDSLSRDISAIGDSSFQENFKKWDAKQDLKTGKTYWFSIRLKNEYKPEERLDRFFLEAGVFSKTIEIYWFDPEQQQLLSKHIGENYEANSAFTLEWWFFSGLIKEIPIPKQQDLNLYLKVVPALDWSFGEHGEAFILTNLEHIKQNNFQLGYKIILYAGFMIMMIVYSLGLYFIIRESAYLYYALFALSVLAYNASIFRLTHFLTPHLFPEQAEYELLFRLFIYVGFFSFLYFCKDYLELKKYLPRWHRIFQGFGIFALLFLGFELTMILTSDRFPWDWSSDYIRRLPYIAIPFVLLIAAFIIPALKLPFKKKYFLLAGIASLCISATYVLITTIVNNGISANAFFLLLVGSAVELIFFALGLAYRIKENEVKKREAFTQLQAIESEKRFSELEQQRLKEMDDLKTQLYTNITHEFRTPLTIIMGISDTIKGHLEEKGLIKRNSQNLLQLINQLLDLSKLEVGELKVNYIQTDIIPFLNYLTDSFISMARDKEVNLAFYSEADQLVMDFDEQKIQHIIYNLLSNAIKFTSFGGRVVFHVKAEDEQLILKVKDNGKGIAEAHLPHIFNRFYQADSELSRAYEGTGIGLALTKDLVELMGGEIQVKSQWDKGTEFTIQLPIRHEAPMTAIQALEEAMHQQFAPAMEENSSDTAANLPIDPDKASLLVIEDNRDITNYLKLILKDSYNIYNAIDGNVGFQLATEQLPDIIISDVMLPHKNGYELCAELKKDRRTSHIPIILLTGLSDEKDRLAGLNSGADAFLTKPFNKEELIIRLENLVNIRKELQERFATQVVDTSEVPNTHPDDLENTFLIQLKAVINEKMNRSNFQIADLTEGMNMSQVQVYRKLKALTGRTPSQFVRAVRLQKAKNLLLNSELSIAEVAYDVGFADPSYFSRTFQQEFGTSPRDSRN
jgi:signal transduction histidine kinase/DNA-binding response OmpR family regulator